MSNTKEASLATLLRTQSERFPERRLFTFLNLQGEIVESYSYQSFEKHTNFLAATLQAEGKIHYGQPVLLLYPPGLEMIAAFFACIKMGAIPVPIPPLSISGVAKNLDKVFFIAAECGANVILSDDIQAARYHTSSHGLNNIPRFDWVNTPQIKGELNDFEIRHNPLLFLQFTSGSTRDPRGVMVSHANVIHNGLGYINLMPDDPFIGVSWLPHYHDMGLIGHYLFVIIAAGSMYKFSALDFLRRPLLWLEAITRFGATSTSAPNFAFEYCLREDKLPVGSLHQIDLSSLKEMMNGAEPAWAQTINKFFKKFQPYGLSVQALTVAYGLAEHTLCVSCLGRKQIQISSELNSTQSSKLVSCGSPLPGLTIKVVDPSTLEIKTDAEVGEIWVDSPSKAVGYWGKPELSENVFRARTIDIEDERSYLRTGDIGFIQNGELYVCGRLNDMIVIRGANVFPSDIEAVIESNFPAIEAGRVVAFGTIHKTSGASGITVLIEARAVEQVPNLAQIHHIIVEACQVPVHTLAIVPRGTIFKTTSGKIARQKCKWQWLKGEVKVQKSINPVDVDISTLEIEDYLDALMTVRELDSDQMVTIGQLGLDSLDLVTLNLKIEALAQECNLFNAELSNTLSDLRILQSITINEVKLLAKKIRAGNIDLKLLSKMYNNALESVEENERIQMREDAILPEDIRPKSNFVPPPHRIILLTGGTGFLGSFLAESLFRLTTDKVLLLVRAKDIDHAKRRIEKVLKKAGVSAEKLPDIFNTRIELLCGDITLPKLGLSEAIWSNIVSRVTTIYHCGAEVDYVKPYSKLRSANVMGVLEILRLACTGIPKELHHISTTFIFGWTVHANVLENERNLNMEGLNFGYSQSKWVAEQLIFEAHKRGVKVNVFRPSLISASKNGQYMQGDITTRVIGYMMRQGISTNAINQLSLLPVDVTANNIVAIAILTNDITQNTYHVTAGSYYTMQDVTKIIHRHFSYEFSYGDIDDFLAHIDKNCTKEDDLYPLVPFFNNNNDKLKSMGHKRYDNRNYRELCQLSNNSMAEPPLEYIVSWIVSFLKKEKLVPEAATHCTSFSIQESICQ